MESIYHIETDLKCKVLDNGTMLCIAQPGQDTTITLCKGRHKLSFVSTEDWTDTYTIALDVSENDIENFIKVNLKTILRVCFDNSAVDLGLSVKWSSFNLQKGELKPEYNGDYYAWGETETKDCIIGYDYDYDEDHEFVFYEEGSYKWGRWCELTKYCDKDHQDYWAGPGLPDGKTVLDPEDDAAHVVIGGGWRIPSVLEWKELLDKCTWEKMRLDGRRGYNVTGPNGNSIFLPIAGLYDYPDYYNACGAYWSSSLYEGSPCRGWYMCLDSSGVQLEDYHRYAGLSIRPVTDALNNDVRELVVSLQRFNTRAYKSEEARMTIWPWNSAETMIKSLSSYNALSISFNSIEWKAIIEKDYTDYAAIESLLIKILLVSKILLTSSCCDPELNSYRFSIKNLPGAYDQWEVLLSCMRYEVRVSRESCVIESNRMVLDTRSDTFSRISPGEIPPKNYIYGSIDALLHSVYFTLHWLEGHREHERISNIIDSLARQQ